MRCIIQNGITRDAYGRPMAFDHAAAERRRKAYAHNDAAKRGEKRAAVSFPKTPFVK